MTRKPISARLLPLALAVGGLMGSSAASALTLLQAYEAALQNDPAYRAAYYQAEAGKENRILGRSALLPSVSGAYSGSQNRSTLNYNGGKDVAQDYISRSATIQVRQPLFSMDAWARYKQGAAQSEYAAAQFDSQAQEVLMRVLGNYFEVLLKEDQLAYAKAERDMYVEQRNVNDLLYKRGEGTRTDLLETQSRLELAEAQLLETQDALNNAREALNATVGASVELGALDHLRPGLSVERADIKGFETWRALALANNPDIRTQQKNIEIAKQEINKQRAGHAPRVDLVGTYGKTSSDTLSTIDQDTTVRSIGFQVNIPFYSGGAVSASTRQAVANREKALADLQGQTDKVLLDLRKNYNQIVSSQPKFDALERAVASAKLLITATEQSIKGGVRINLDLLTAQRQLFGAQRDLAQARYGYLLAVLRLRADAGTLTPEDVRMVAAYFE
ncbi:outer membrane protein, protease secretion system [Duganella sp. CF402]|uniref:TolC family outer membrane protein n=1 Tax=unclassified Duganella TaxID=2636909 RepID=UPI0008BC0D01|nr:MULTISPECIES: TolC family outer membrane protein [unclassified Duganella]RZT08694.1 protease secretion system outer membrane protein [Duganella sp. BK701]SEL85140.1 outer membrane protein, protease secretion system [Duganella sp. CF402]